VTKLKLSVLKHLVFYYSHTFSRILSIHIHCQKMPKNHILSVRACLH